MKERMKLYLERHPFLTRKDLYMMFSPFTSMDVKNLIRNLKRWRYIGLVKNGKYPSLLFKKTYPYRMVDGDGRLLAESEDFILLLQLARTSYSHSAVFIYEGTTLLAHKKSHHTNEFLQQKKLLKLGGRLF